MSVPVDVGEALVSYLRRRPCSEYRTVFLKVLAPVGPMSGNAIWGVMHDACVRAGIPAGGPHQLRYTAAIGMLKEGASLEEIAEVLRHRQLKTTAIYAKVDRRTLREIAQPWPEGGAA